MLFEKTFQKLMNYYLLKESVLNDVPRNVMGMSTSVQDLPEHAPYGFWIDRSGNFIVVGQYSHENVGEDLIRKASNYLKTKGIHYSFNRNVYKSLFAMGWARVVTDYFDVLYEMGMGEDAHTPSTAQMRLLNFMKDYYEKGSVRGG